MIPKRSGFTQQTLFLTVPVVGSPAFVQVGAFVSRPFRRSQSGVCCDRGVILSKLTHVTVGRTQLVTDCWSEDLSSLLALGQRPPSVPCHGGQSTEQLPPPRARLQPSPWESVLGGRHRLLLFLPLGQPTSIGHLVYPPPGGEVSLYIFIFNVVASPTFVEVGKGLCSF